MIVSREGCEVGVSSLVLGYSNGFENGLIQYNKRTVEDIVEDMSTNNKNDLFFCRAYRLSSRPCVRLKRLNISLLGFPAAGT